MSQPEIARARVDLDGAQAGIQLKNLEARAKELRMELTKLGADNDLAGFKQREKELKLVQKQMKDLKKSTWDVEQVLNRLNGASFNELTRAQRQLNSEIKRMTVNTKEEAAAYKLKIDQLRMVNIQLDKVKNEMHAAKTAQQSWLSSAAQGFNKYFAIVSAGIATLTGVVFSIKSLIQGNSELDDSLADVMKTTGLTKREVRELYTEFKNFNTRTPRRELLQLAVEAGRLGKKSKKDVMDFVEVANQIKVALGDDLGGNAEVAIREVGKLTSIYRVGEKYGVDFRKSMLMVGSSINEVSANSQAQAGYLIELTKRMAGVSSQAGIEVQDVIGYAAALDAMGQSGEISATTLNKIIVNMFKDVSTYSKLAGLSTKEFSDLLRNDANEALLKVLEGLNGNNEGLSEMAGKLDGLGLDGARSVQVLAALASNVDLVRTQQDLANKSLEQATSLTNEYNIKNNNMAGGLEKIGRVVRAAFINSKINQTLSNIITSVAKWIEIPVSKTMEDQRTKINLLTIELTDANVQEKRKKEIWDELLGLAPEVLNNINQESINTDQLTKNLAKYNEETIRKIALQSAGEDMAKIQEKYGKKTSERLKEEEYLREALFLIQKEAARWDKDRAEKISQILLSNEDILDKQKQIESIGQEINKNENARVLNLAYAYNSAYQIVNLREEENGLLQQSNEELSKYQRMYKSIMGDSGSGKNVLGPMPFDYSSLSNKPLPVDDETKKKLEKEEAYRIEIIKGAWNLVDQENAAFEERLKKAGLFGKKRENLTKLFQKALDILTYQHEENVKKINEQAYNDDILEQKKLFDRITEQRLAAHKEELASMGNNEQAKKIAEETFQKQELERQQRFLQGLLSELQSTLDKNDLKGIDESLLSEEQKEKLRTRIDQVKLMLADLGIKLNNLKGGQSDQGGESKLFGSGGGNTDIFGMSADDWANLIQNIADGNFGLEETIAIIGVMTNAYSEFAAIRNNLDQRDLQQYEEGIQKKRDLLDKQLKNGKISQAEYTAEVSMMDSSLDKKRREIANKAAKRERAAALMGAIVNTAASIVKMLDNPWPLNLVLAAAVGVAGGFQIAKILSTPVPQYYGGYYDVIGQKDGKKYNAAVSSSADTGLINSPTILVGEKPEIIIDPYTTRNLQMNYPEVIQAIMAARVPQYASGYYPGSMKETVTERPLPKEFYLIMSSYATQMQRLNDRLDAGIDAKLKADSAYVRAHNEVMKDYDALKKKVDMQA